MSATDDGSSDAFSLITYVCNRRRHVFADVLEGPTGEPEIVPAHQSVYVPGSRPGRAAPRPLARPQLITLSSLQREPYGPLVLICGCNVERTVTAHQIEQDLASRHRRFILTANGSHAID